MTNTSTTAVAEVVTYRLAEGVDEAGYLDLITRSQAFAGACPRFLARNVSKGEDGLWMDHVLWASMEDAQAAAAGFMEQEFSPEFGAALAEGSVTIRHEHIMWQAE